MRLNLYDLKWCAFVFMHVDLSTKYSEYTIFSLRLKWTRTSGGRFVLESHKIVDEGQIVVYSTMWSFVIACKLVILSNAVWGEENAAVLSAKAMVSGGKTTEAGIEDANNKEK